MLDKGTLYLIPSMLGDTPPENVFPANHAKVISGIHYFIVEELRTARRFLKKICPETDLDRMIFTVYNEHSGDADLQTLIQPLLNGEDAGIIPEAGTPCVADPGSGLVSLAHASDIRVVPLVGPSSILMALMASGFNGQSFAFHGYLPIDRATRAKKIREIETEARTRQQTQIFIETPYRNLQLFRSILENCRDNTLLCIAVSLTGPDESILSKPVKEWKQKIPEIHKKPAIFLLYC